jgi:hypothetical protein
MKGMIECDDFVGSPFARAPHLRASLIAPSFASAPLLVKNTRWKQLCATMRPASSIAGALENPGPGVIRVRDCLARTSAMRGGQWPKVLTAQPWTKSRYGFPS